MREWNRWFLILLGAFIYSIGLNAFLVANHLAEGGFVGISLLLLYKLHWPLSVSFLVLNIPLLLVSWRVLGTEFVVKTTIGVGAVSLFSWVTSKWLLPTGDPLLGALYAGVVCGFGLGLIFRANATTGGSDIIARLLRHFRGVTMGRTLFGIDVCVIGVVALIIGYKTAMYSLVASFIATRVVDFVLEGVNTGKALTIISEHNIAIAGAIHEQLERGTTLLQARGGFTGQQKQVVYCVVPREEVPRVQRIVSEIDPRAFVVVNNVHEVLGEGFTFD